MAQKVLAEQVTTLVHGSRALDNSLRIADMIYKTPPRELKSQEVLEAMQYESNFSRMKWKDVKGVVVGKMMVVLGLCTSRGKSSYPVPVEATPADLAPQHIRHGLSTRN